MKTLLVILLPTAAVMSWWSPGEALIVATLTTIVAAYVKDITTNPK